MHPLFIISKQTSYLSQISQVIYVEKKLSCGEFSAFHGWRLQGNQHFLYMWRNFKCLPMTDVEKSEILHIWHVCDVENVAIYAKFMLFSWKKSVFFKIYELCREIRFVVIYALLCGEKFVQKFSMWRKMTNMRSGFNNFYLLPAQVKDPDLRVGDTTVEPGK